jgi:RNA polymerase sigma-70 factor (ECF subfamily)
LINDELIQRCISEEPKAQYELYRELYSLMMSVCVRYERNKQDAVAKMNEGFLKVLTHLKSRNEQVPFELWVRRIMINTVIDVHRKNKNRKESEVLSNELEMEPGEAVNEFIAEMEAEELQRMLNELPEMTGRVFNLFAIDGYNHNEIAEMLQMSEGTSRWHVSAARRQLQQSIMKEVNKTKKATA